MGANILVVGATGKVGHHLVKALVAHGDKVRAASRHADPIAGVETAAFNLTAPGNLVELFDGIDAVYLLSPTGYLDPLALLTPLVAEAARRGIKIVLQTAIGVDADEAIPLRRLERAVEASGSPYVILRPNWFADNFAVFWREDVLRGLIEVPASDGRTSFVDARDIADSAVAALTQSRFDGQAFVLTGPHAYTYAEAAVILSEAYGYPVRYQAIEDDAFVRKMTAAGLNAPYAELLARIFHGVREGWTAGITDAVPTLTGYPARDLSQWARETPVKG